MANRCWNVATFTNHSLSAIMRIADAFKKTDLEYGRRGGLFSEFAPIPMTESEERRLVGESRMPAWLLERVQRWGTKWDVCDEDPRTIEFISESGVRLRYDTAWAPPIPFYNTMLRLGYGIHAYYLEPDEGYCGEYYNGRDLMFQNLNLEGNGQQMRTKLRTILRQFGLLPLTVHEMQSEVL